MKNSELNGTEFFFFFDIKRNRIYPIKKKKGTGFKTMLLNTRNGIYLQGLYYCSILSGVIRGALEIVNNTNIFCWTTLTLSSYFYFYFLFFLGTFWILITDILSHEHDFKNQLLLFIFCFCFCGSRVKQP